MEIIRKTEDIRPEGPAAIALGAFDGLHPGHRRVIDAAVTGAYSPAVFTFSSNPSGAPELLLPREREALFEKMGVETLYSMDFSLFRGMDAERFVRDVLFDRCKAKKLCCGGDFHFGRGAAGNAELLMKLCNEAGVELEVVPPVEDEKGKISSSRARAAVEKGDVETAARLLGRYFGFTLPVVHGNHLGAGMGTPTINQEYPEGLVVPAFGVYAAWCRVGNENYYGAANVGVKPTVGSERLLCETWMPEYSGDLYGREVTVKLISFIRPERKFSSLDELREEILRNAGQAKEICRRMPPEI